MYTRDYRAMVELSGMSYTIVGLGNPGEEYADSRHNVGRVMVNAFAKKQDFPQWDTDKKSKSLISEGCIGRESVTLVLPETYMNKSGLSVKTLYYKQKKGRTAYRGV